MKPHRKPQVTRVSRRSLAEGATSVRLAPPRTPQQTAAFEELLRWALRAMGEGPRTADEYVARGRAGDWTDALDALAIFYTMKHIPFTRVSAPGPRGSLAEAAVSLGEAGGAGLALYFRHDAKIDQEVWVLWSPAEAEALIESIAAGPLGEEYSDVLGVSPEERRSDRLLAARWTLFGAALGDAWREALLDTAALRRVIRGLIAVKPNADGRAWGASEVTLSAAQHGYGPLMYDIAFSAYPGLVPDRDAVSKSAGRVWTHYFASRGDVSHRPLDDIKDPQTPEPEDDAELHRHNPLGDDSGPNPLNYAYELEAPLGTAPLLAASEAALGDLKERWGWNSLFPGWAITWFFTNSPK